MRSRARAEADHEEENSERWLLTYSDMITLLLALFIILFAISDLNHAKYAELRTNLHASFNGTSQSNLVVATKDYGSQQPPKPTPKPNPQNSLATIEAQLVAALTKAGLIHDVEFGKGVDGLTLGFVASKTFYDTDSATLSPLGMEIVDVAGGVLRLHPNLVNVDGYTDDQPITGGPYRDNWELSAERSEVVVERLSQVDHVDPGQLYVVGLGQYHPFASNTTPAGRAENRRVDIVIAPDGAKSQLP